MERGKSIFKAHFLPKAGLDSTFLQHIILQTYIFKGQLNFNSDLVEFDQDSFQDREWVILRIC